MAFELTSKKLADTFVMPLKNPEDGLPILSDTLDEQGNPKPVSITLYGTASKQYRNAVASMQNRTLRQRQKKDYQPTVEQLNDEGISLLVACTASASELTHNGKVPVTAQDFRDLYTDPTISWVKQQVDEALGDMTNFLAQ